MGFGSSGFRILDFSAVFSGVVGCSLGFVESGLEGKGVGV